MKNKNSDKEHPVGYKNPPRQTRFKPGQSGNPKGRPKKSASLSDVLAKQLRAPVQIASNGKTKTISMLEAIVKQHTNKAATGDPKAARLIFDHLKDDKSGAGDNLASLIQEFRARHAQHRTTDIAGNNNKDGAQDPYHDGTKDSDLEAR
jgi:hypothetical protein